MDEEKYNMKEFDDVDEAIFFAVDKEQTCYAEFWTRDDGVTFVVDDADEEDCIINGTVHFDSVVEDDEIMWAVQKTIEKLQEKYRQYFTDFPKLKLELLDANFEDGWIDYSLEGVDGETACIYWKKSQDVELAPTPESKVGVHH